MIVGIQDVHYNAQDMKRALGFYTGVLGMKVLNDDPWWATLDLNGTRIGLHWTNGSTVAQVPRDSHGAHGGATLTLRSNDIDADEKKLRERDVKILGRLDAAWGKIVVFEDTEGNVLKLMQA
jgi:catechol 2,3-dioxygenase-like lactoylglutathione lyase family enzyme